MDHASRYTRRLAPLQETQSIASLLHLSMLKKVLTSTLFNRCPNCMEGRVFSHNNPYHFKHIFGMYKSCLKCGFRFDREPGYFTGAMYVAYAMTSGWFILWFLLELTLLDWNNWFFSIFMMSTIVLLAPLTFRWSRILWLNLFK